MTYYRRNGQIDLTDRIAIEKRYNERIDIYKSTCDMRISADESAEKIAEIIGKEFFN